MFMIFEEDIERSDYIEIVLSPAQVEMLVEKGVVKDFPRGLRGKRNLNVYIRVDKTITEEDEECSQEKQPSVPLFVLINRCSTKGYLPKQKRKPWLRKKSKPKK